jgi:hypothetical protein
MNSSEWKAKSTELHEEARRIVSSGVCPDCASGLRQNLAILGWWQCEQYGSDGFRADSAKPQCSFQTFTD